MQVLFGIDNFSCVIIVKNYSRTNSSHDNVAEIIVVRQKVQEKIKNKTRLRLIVSK